MASYTIENIELPGVTTVLKLIDKSDMLIPWALNECEKKLGSLLSTIDEDIPIYNTKNVLDIFSSSKYAHKEVSGEALSVGSEVHGIVEIYIKRKIKDSTKEHPIEELWNEYILKLLPEKRPTIIRDQVIQGFFAFLDWEKEHIDKWIDSEKTVYSLIYGFAGTLDGKALFKDEKVRIVDFKTSKKIYDENYLQVSAYKYADFELTFDYFFF